MPMNLALPGNPRYQPQALVPIFGYDNHTRFIGMVELACLKALYEMGVMPAKTWLKLNEDHISSVLEITTTRVDRAERKTKHDIRAWIEEAKKEVPQAVQSWLHLLLTSYDVIDTARILQFRQAHAEVVRPLCWQMLGIMAGLVEKFSTQLQIGRTHGQHALPITVGFWLATILSRMLRNFAEMEVYANNLVGKVSGAVGAYNAQVCFGVLLPGKPDFEDRVLEELGLKRAAISTQILPPEPLAYYLFSCLMMSASLAQFGRDCRHLMRSEIGEVAEEFAAGQSGSSTMAHKRNPVNFEKLEGLHAKTLAEFMKVFFTLVSEHQRDLTGSSVARDFPTIVVNLVEQLNTLLKPNDKGVSFLERMTVSPERCQANFEQNKNVIMAEALYIAIQMAGYKGDGHALVNHQLVPRARVEGKLLAEVADQFAKEDEDFSQAWARVPEQVRSSLFNPEGYTGIASHLALEVAREVREYIGQ